MIYYATEKAAKRVGPGKHKVTLHSGPWCPLANNLLRINMVKVPEENLPKMNFRRCQYCFG
jgi:hypothetical protein